MNHECSRVAPSKSGATLELRSIHLPQLRIRLRKPPDFVTLISMLDPNVRAATVTVNGTLGCRLKRVKSEQLVTDDFERVCVERPIVILFPTPVPLAL